MSPAYKKYIKRRIILDRVGKPYRRIPKRTRLQKERKRKIFDKHIKRMLSGGKRYTVEEFIVMVKERRKIKGQC